MTSFVIETEKISKNAQEIFRRARNAKVFAVVKGSGYGFGIDKYVSVLYNSGVRLFAVTEVEDALEIKKLNLSDIDILMLRSTVLEDELEALIKNDIILTVGSNEAAISANNIATENHRSARCHIKIDTGMGRYGFPVSETENIISCFTKFDHLSTCGMYTHLNCAFKSKRITEKQVDKLFALRQDLSDRGIDCKMLHFANSAYLFKFGSKALGDAVRIGSAFTGRLACKTGRSSLSKVGYLESNICEIRWLSPGSTVGYGAAYTARHAVRAAVVPVGYSNGFGVEKARDTYRIRDGLFYILSDIKRTITRKKVYVTINGKKSPILGHLGMTHTVCDITDIECAIGDCVRFDVNPIYVSSDVYKDFV